ncbi:MAG: homoserine O-acetyltransferase [Muribaculaceae bacterium]|nr:homoserine O-acetyltransferase [Muribaculaceae bacterium]
MARHIYRHPEAFALSGGGVIKNLEICYDTYGTLSPEGDNVVWVCHALTADSAVDDWWPHTVEAGAFLDPDRYFTVCANVIGSCYGTTGPLHINPATGRPWYGIFPAVSIADMARAHELLADALGIKRIRALVGSSVGGFQAIEWAVQHPLRFDSLVLIATAPVATPWAIAIDETQRMAIRADATFGTDSPDAGAAGLEAARALGLLTYRGPAGYNLTQQDHHDSTEHRACTYQRHQGAKLRKRFNAYSYVSLLDAFDTHDIGRGRGGMQQALSTLTMPVLTVGISTDLVFLPDEVRAIAEGTPAGRYAQIDSPFGHDGFLVEHRQLNDIIKPFIDNL